MDLYQIGGFAFSAIIATLGILKIELIKEIVKKITSNQEKINIFSVVLLLLISIVPIVIGFNIPSNTENRAVEVHQIAPQKSKEEVYLEAGKEIITLGRNFIHYIEKIKRIVIVFFLQIDRKGGFIRLEI